MSGTNRNRRIVDDAEVGKILTLCYIDPKLKGESYFRNTKEKNLYEKKIIIIISDKIAVCIKSDLRI